MVNILKFIQRLRGVYGHIARSIEELVELMNRGGDFVDIKAKAESIVPLLAALKKSVEKETKIAEIALKKDESLIISMKDISANLYDLSILIKVSGTKKVEGKVSKLIKEINGNNQDIKQKLNRLEVKLEAITKRSGA